VKRFYGKYRGTVVNNVDPNRAGRMQVSCPFVLGENLLAWAMPCVPFAGVGEGFYMLPTIGSNIWVEFEAGDPDRPIWSGAFWTSGQIPTEALLPTVRTISTLAGSVTLDDTPGAGGVKITVGAPAVIAPCTISFGIDGIEITVGHAKITLDVAKVDVNDGALQVI
jgi:hypothetical protein